MFKRIKYFSIFCVISFLWLQNIQAQSVDDARVLYLQGKYDKALPVFEQAVKKTPKNASYNQWYGNCLLETGKTEKAREYLLFAASKKIVEAYGSLGKMHYLLYEFEESAEAYAQYVELLAKDKKSKDSIQALLLMRRSERAARMLSRCEDIQIIDSIIMDKRNFLDAYFFSSECGSLENSGGSVVYENPLKEKRYFSEKRANGSYRLYSEIRIQDKWVDRKELDLSSDSLDNDNYPFVLQDGLTIYFASTGDASIGGYDLFVTRYNLNSDTYLTPNQLGMPFNSIANDYMLAIDEINNIGYFATDRFQPENKVAVYTFIPNEEIISIQTNNGKELISRAKIVSIKSSWKPGMNYKEQLLDIRANILNEQTKETKDFAFVINDNTIYYTLSDFQNSSAKQFFLKSREMKESIDRLTNELEDLRSEFAGPNKNRKQSARSNILSKEKQLESLLYQYEQTVIDARNQEVKHLRIKN
jgi:tetratricopeptide (TPR) repeat protein